MNAPAITPELILDLDLCSKILTGFIQSEVQRAGFHRVIVGLSGGLDSSLSATLAAHALRSENVWGVSMPFKASSPESAVHARLGTLGFTSLLLTLAGGLGMAAICSGGGQGDAVLIKV